MIRQLVDRLAAEVGGGEPYFDNLDAGLRNPWVFRALNETAWALFGPACFVVSGKFGDAYIEWHMREHTDTVVWVGGGARKGYTIGQPMLMPSDRKVTPSKLVFLDDSYYQGRTFRAVRGVLGDRVLGAVVAYDGASAPHEDIYSLYRWRDRCFQLKSSSSAAPSSDSTPSGASTATTTSQ